MRRAAIVENGKIVNVSLCPAGERGDQIIAARGLVEIPTGSHAGIGWEYDGETFADNRPKPEPKPDPEARVSDEVAALARLLDVDPEAVKTEMTRITDART